MPVVRIDVRALQKGSDLFVDRLLEVITGSIETEQSCGLRNQILTSNTDSRLHNLKHCKSILAGGDTVGSAQRQSCVASVARQGMAPFPRRPKSLLRHNLPKSFGRAETV